mmetsp:Transcript_10650/g.33855  ORF Transcript_10650/g.33855 Transcript_10650/m.33855 type:complete len:220 (+) Transcript_10650:1165-1824(+)
MQHELDHHLLVAHPVWWCCAVAYLGSLNTSSTTSSSSPDPSSSLSRPDLARDPVAPAPAIRAPSRTRRRRRGRCRFLHHSRASPVMTATATTERLAAITSCSVLSSGAPSCWQVPMAALPTAASSPSREKSTAAGGWPSPKSQRRRRSTWDSHAARPAIRVPNFHPGLTRTLAKCVCGVTCGAASLGETASAESTRARTASHTSPRLELAHAIDSLTAN